MTRSLVELEARRQRLFQEMAELGEFPPGMISTNYRRCGKKLCLWFGCDRSGCKTIVGYRLKQSGMRWSLRGANAII